MVLSPEERAQIVANNKSLRLIKNELEFLAERNVLSDDAYDTILSALPTESPLRAGALPTPTPSAAPVRSAASPAPVIQTPAANLTDSFSNMSVNQPAFPSRNPTPQPPPQKQELCHATALYAYQATDAGDLALNRDDHISVTEYMNAEWWSGINVRTGATGIFPKNYVRVENYPSTLNSAPPQYNEKAGYSPYTSHQPNYAQPQQSSYNNAVPPMAVANEQGQVADPAQPNKGKEFGKKVAGKFGNAAVFGAGATVGSNIINSIF